MFHSDYTFIKDFIDKYLPQGFKEINRQDSFITEMEQKLTSKNQFFYIADMLSVQILFTTAGSQHILGVNPEQVDASTFFVLAHPEDQGRLNYGQTMLFQLGQELFTNEKGISIVSIHTRQKNGQGNYLDLMLQTYSFYSEIPHKTVYTVIVATHLTHLNPSRQGFHFYSGFNEDMFRYPDEVLLNESLVYSERELDILKLIADGKGSEQIADKLFISVNTVNTHRRNILKKGNKSTTQDLIVELKEKGLL